MKKFISLVLAGLMVFAMVACGDTKTQEPVVEEVVVEDEAGDEEDSWKTAFENEGYETSCVLEGLGQVPAVRALYVEHVKAAIDQL